MIGRVEAKPVSTRLSDRQMSPGGRASHASALAFESSFVILNYSDGDADCVHEIVNILVNYVIVLNGTGSNPGAPRNLFRRSPCQRDCKSLHDAAS